MKKKNIFDTEIEMIDLDSIGEISYDGLDEPNPELGNDVEMVMKETQVFSAEDIEAAISRHNEELNAEQDFGATKVVPEEDIEAIENVAAYDVNYTNEEVAEEVTGDTVIYNAAELEEAAAAVAGETVIYNPSEIEEAVENETVASEVQYNEASYDNEEYSEEESTEEYSKENAEEEYSEEENSEEEYANENEETSEDQYEEASDESEEEQYEEASEEQYDEAENTEETEAEYAEESEVENGDAEVGEEAAAGAAVAAMDKVEEDESYDFENDVPKEKKVKKKVQNADNRNGNGKGRKKKKKEKGLAAFLKNAGAVEYAGIALAVALVILLVVLGVKLIGNNTQKKDINQFASIGQLFSDIDTIGNEGIQAIGQKAYIDSITPDEEEVKEVAEEEKDKEEEEEEEEKDKVAPVSVNFSSIEKDLKIKFIDKTTGKLVSGVRFEVSAKGPKGDKFSWVDTDMDGVIYIDKLEPGNYEVRVISVEPYEFPETTTVVKVQDTVVYQVINVIDEAEDMSKVNLAQEDVQGKDVDQGATLQDTVSVVESSATPVNGSDGFVKIDKSKIKDPKTLASAFSWGGFRKVDAVTLTAGETKEAISLAEGQTAVWSPGNDAAEGSGTMITAKAAGSASLSVEIKDAEGNTVDTKNFEVTVNPKAEEPKLVTGITISGSTEVTVGSSTKLSAAVAPSDAANQTLNWTSSDPAKATVDGSGNVTGLAEGGVTITASATDGSGIFGTYTVNVKAANVAVNSVTLNAASVEVGKTVQLSWAIDPGNATNKGVTFASDKTDVATVDGNGVVTGKAAGDANITITTVDGGKTATAKVTVTAANVAVTGVTISGDTSVAVGSTITLKAAVAPDNATNKAVNWSSSKPEYATVDASGNVKGVAAGTTTITATAADGSGKSATYNVTVVSAAASKMTVTGPDGKEVQSTLTLYTGNTYQLTAKVEGASDTGVKYASSNNAVTVSDSGLITAATAGSADVTITSNAKGSDGNQIVKKISITVKTDPTKDTTSKLMYYSEKEKKDVSVYIKTSDGKYIEATYADYYKDGVEFYVKGDVEYKYTGWQNLDGNVYYFDGDGKKVTGEQVIGGTKYNFASDGSLVKDSGSRGIDVSAYQGTIDWTAVKNSGISFVIIRCGFRGYTKGGLIIDSKYKSYIQGANAAGLKVGLYIFSQATNEAEAVEEASLCVNLAQGYKISYPIFIDSEYANGAHNGRADGLDKGTRTAVCKAFCETIKSAGYTPGVYASKSWFYNKLDAGQLSSYKIWMAHYCGETDYKGKYDLWQHSSKGSVNGIKGNVDLDISYMGY